MCFLPFFVLFFCYSDSLQAVYRREDALAFAAREERCPNRITHTNYSLRFHEHVDIYLYVCACISLPFFFLSFVDFGVLWRGRGGVELLPSFSSFSLAVFVSTPVFCKFDFSAVSSFFFFSAVVLILLY